MSVIKEELNCTKHVKNGKEDFIPEYCNGGQDIAI